jgi:hypothetical protein
MALAWRLPVRYSQYLVPYGLWIPYTVHRGVGKALSVVVGRCGLWFAVNNREFIDNTPSS